MEKKVLDAVTRSPGDVDLFLVQASIQPPGMVPSENSQDLVQDLLVFGHSEIERLRLDQFEGTEFLRTRKVTVHGTVPAKFTLNRSHDHVPGVVEAHIYVFAGPTEHLDMSRPWDYEAFKREHLSRWMTDPAFATMIGRANEVIEPMIELWYNGNVVVLK
ncbi:hypothetical protein BG006_002722 [Podila minutissima]|uniref:Uncharacterized protein n=1 Tax=Podila minutissima TaxID=64525 RepID=A0A9P5VNL7_9FUNG|nr:hypothetical protein BG006_002722 [Podila minutissima]